MTLSTYPLAAVEVLAEGVWPAPGDPRLPAPLAGFAVSSFSPMASAAADRCLEPIYGAPGAQESQESQELVRRAGRTAIVLASRGGDLETHTATAVAVDAGRPAAPLLFFQSVPNAVVGHIAKRWGLAGPVICFSPDAATADPLSEALDVARSLVDGGDTEEALLLLVEQAGPDGAPANARALLVRPAPFAGEAP
ncbi:beta-ketoacyl synthase chain length factor [Streptomyces sp. NBC_01264]|uniref:beta-ketoacyl synthase chain length factor n=1 Tax=Streptomyces sp. NBC_01264 TaxID=2903804 RepID=UPI00225A6D63|nr:beta-ketoacyl synthase chain length factor [Streptomyces sp. NBC_01264]MCX4783762.1 beta-ketoacyl synthase chain length factor [Streptomyces sp. NBC_01264]